MSQLSRRHRFAVLAICCMSLVIVGLDNTIVNVALPSIRRDLHASVAGLQWTIDAYTLVLASLLLIAGSTADRLGRRRVFQTGLLVFTAGSLACSLAPGLTWLVAFRMMQAVGGSMLNPVALSIVTNTFTEPRERAQAIGIWGSVVGLSMAVGPVIGGALVESVGWRSIFWINVPVGLMAVGLAQVFVPESRAAHPRKADTGGQVLVVILLSSLTYAIIEGSRWGWSSPRIVSLFLVSGLAVIGIGTYEPRRAEPLIELGFFRSVPFTGATVTAICAFFGLGAFLFLNTLYLQEVRGLSALHAGLYLLPMAGTAALSAPVAGRVVGRRGTRWPLLLAGAAITISGLMLTELSPTTPRSWLLTAYAVFGLGFGLVNAPLTHAAVSGMPISQAGVAAATTSTSRHVGQSLGVAVAGAIASAGMHDSLRTSFAIATHVSWWLVAGCGTAVFALGWLATTPWALATAARAAGLLDPDGTIVDRGERPLRARRNSPQFSDP